MPRLAPLGNCHPGLRRCWHPVARCSEVSDRPVRVRLLGEAWVLVRVGGTLRAFVDRCPHRLAPLSIGCSHGDTLACAYHGWRFDGEGRCVEIPALGSGGAIPPRARLEAAHGVTERHGMVFLAPEAPLAPLGDVPEDEDPSFSAGDLPVLTAKASAGLLADNFLDMAHFPFVHASTFGAEDPVVPPLTVSREPWSFLAVTEHEFLNREDPGVAAGIRPLVQRRRVTYRVVAPFHLVLRIDFLDAGGTNVIGFFLQPESEESCKVYSTIWRDDLEGDPGRIAAAVAFELRVVEEDLVVQQAYDDLCLPLDMTAEIHTKADRSTVELQRLRDDLVVAAESVPRHDGDRGAAGRAAEPAPAV